MKLKTILVILAGLLIFSGCERADETPQVRERVTRYWEAIYSGRIHAAYEMLDNRSRGSMSYLEFGKAVAGLGAKVAPEIDAFYKAYTPLTSAEIKTVYVEKKSARVGVHLTHPDPTWFPSAAYDEAVEAGLADHELAICIISAKTQALYEGEIPIVDLTVTVRLLKEDDLWRIVFYDYRQ